MRLINADELRKCAIPCGIHNGALTDLCVPLYQIDNAPTVEERQQGEWIKDRVAFYQGCPECGAYIRSNASEIYLNPRKINFCPNCGADMRGSVNYG